MFMLTQVQCIVQWLILQCSITWYRFGSVHSEGGKGLLACQLTCACARGACMDACMTCNCGNHHITSMTLSDIPQHTPYTKSLRRHTHRLAPMGKQAHSCRLTHARQPTWGAATDTHHLDTHVHNRYIRIHEM